MLEGFSTIELFLCWVAWARQRLESGVIWTFTHSCIWWLLLATDQGIHWVLCKYPHMPSSSGWRLPHSRGAGSKSESPTFYNFSDFVLEDTQHYFQICDHTDSALDHWRIKVILSEKHVEWEIMLQPFWNLSFAPQTMLLDSKGLDILSHFLLTWHLAYLAKPYSAFSGWGVPINTHTAACIYVIGLTYHLPAYVFHQSESFVAMFVFMSSWLCLQHI